jgi:D-glycero-beta-D-manno-heptose 1-phosphate adenylyltransferase
MDKTKFITDKIHTPESLLKLLHLWRFQEKKIVFTNGCFDLLHLGHVDYLSKAASLGDVLVVGVNSDASVSQLKGPNRPLNDEKSRLHILASLFFVNAVIPFGDETPYELIKMVQPDILVKGGDYKPEAIVGYDIVKQKGGEVVTIPFVPGYSTTAIEQKILNSKS